MLGVVINPFFDWGNDRHPDHEYHDAVIYEAHVKGLTMTHPDVPEDIRGTYAGIAHPATIEHLKDLGVTAIELMPVHQFVQDTPLVDKGLANYWGYNTIGFFAPHNAYAASGQRGQQVQEFKAMVKALHEADIEVILDVVYNHTAEGNHLGPTLCFRGIDNNAYYRLVDDDRAHYYDTTGTGNTLLMRHPHVLQLIMDSLRYWVTEMHVDGFRFDLASSLARQFHEVDRLSAFFDLVQQDPVVSQVKLIAEPWDIGEGGYQVGNFPPLWTEWNGKYRDTVRDYWRGESSTLAEFASRITGSSDLYEHSGRKPIASINFVTAHDGFTMRDLVSYNEKHNDANGEDGNDGESHNRSWNCGVEGETDDVEVLELRARQHRNMLTTLLLSQGVPMLLHGDELGRTQRRQQQRLLPGQRDRLDGLGPRRGPARAARLHPSRRRAATRAPGVPAPTLLRRGGRSADGLPADIAWFTPEGKDMNDADWSHEYARSMLVFLNGEAIPEPGPARREGRRRLVPDRLQRPPRAADLHPARRGLRRGLAGCPGHPRRPGRQRLDLRRRPDPAAGCRVPGGGPVRRGPPPPPHPQRRLSARGRLPGGRRFGAMSRPTTLGALRDTGYRTRSVKAEIRDNLLGRLRAGETAFPGIVGFDDTVLPQLESALLAGHDLVLLGERGQGKTRLMRTLVTLLDEWVPAVEGCEINDDPLAPVCARCRRLCRRASATTSRSRGCTAASGTSRSWPRRTPASATSSATSTRSRSPRAARSATPRPSTTACCRAPTAASSASTSCPTWPSGSRWRCSTCWRSATSRCAATACDCPSTSSSSPAPTPRTTPTAAGSSPR